MGERVSVQLSTLCYTLLWLCGLFSSGKILELSKWTQRKSTGHMKQILNDLFCGSCDICKSCRNLKFASAAQTKEPKQGINTNLYVIHWATKEWREKTVCIGPLLYLISYRIWICLGLETDRQWIIRDLKMYFLTVIQYFLYHTCSSTVPQDQ